jgi:hypothetical protein
VNVNGDLRLGTVDGIRQGVRRRVDPQPAPI